MNKIQKFIQERSAKKTSREVDVLAFSDTIKTHIGVSPKMLEEPYTFGKWKIVSQNRRLMDDWYYIFEAYPSKYGDNLGYANVENPDWVKVKGTCSSILMPKDMQREFINDLIAHLKTT